MELLLLQHVAHLLGPGDHLVAKAESGEVGKSIGNPLEIHSDVDGIWRNMEKYGGIGFSCFKPLDQPL